MLTARETKEALIERLLDSPLAAELERSLGTEVARRYIETALEEMTRRHEQRHPPMAAKALELRERRDALARELEQARLAAQVAGNKAVNEQHAFARRSAELRRLAKTSAAQLMALGLDSAEAAQRHIANI